jgi:hypothetical protein
VCARAAKDVRRGHVVVDDVEGWTPAKVPPLFADAVLAISLLARLPALSFPFFSLVSST